MNEPRIEQFDVRGQVCPSSLLLALREVNRLNSDLKNGQVEIVILTDNRNATITIPNALKSMGLSARINKRDDCYQIRIGKESP